MTAQIDELVYAGITGLGLLFVFFGLGRGQGFMTFLGGVVIFALNVWGVYNGVEVVQAIPCYANCGTAALALNVVISDLAPVSHADPFGGYLGVFMAILGVIFMLVSFALQK